MRSYSSAEYLRLPGKAEAVLDETSSTESFGERGRGFTGAAGQQQNRVVVGVRRRAGGEGSGTGWESRRSERQGLRAGAERAGGKSQARVSRRNNRGQGFAKLVWRSRRGKISLTQCRLQLSIAASSALVLLQQHVGDAAADGELASCIARDGRNIIFCMRILYHADAAAAASSQKAAAYAGAREAGIEAICAVQRQAGAPPCCCTRRGGNCSQPSAQLGRCLGPTLLPFTLPSVASQPSCAG